MNRCKVFTVYITTVLLMNMISCQSNKEPMDSKTAIDVIFGRTSIRSYRERPVSKDRLGNTC